jgi:hypothetical protein
MIILWIWRPALIVCAGGELTRALFQQNLIKSIDDQRHITDTRDLSKARKADPRISLAVPEGNNPSIGGENSKPKKPIDWSILLSQLESFGASATETSSVSSSHRTTTPAEEKALKDSSTTTFGSIRLRITDSF